MRLSSAIAGTRAIKRVPLPLQNSDGGSMDVGLRCLLGTELATVYELTNRYAKEHGAAACQDSDPIWSLGCAVYTIAIAAVDVDSDPANPRPFFGKTPDASVEERAIDVLSNPLIGRDSILYLAEQQEIWQDETNPQRKTATKDELWQMVGEVVEHGADPFLRWGPGLRLTFMHFMAVQLLTLLTPSSQSGAPTESSGLEKRKNSASNGDASEPA